MISQAKVLVFSSLGIVSAVVAYGLISEPANKSESVNSTLQSESATVEQCMSKPDSCLQSVGNLDGNTHRSACLHANAVTQMDADYCDNISAANTRQRCVTDLGGSAAEQAVMAEWGAGEPYAPDVKDQCYSDLAYFNRDADFCDKVVSEQEKLVCKQYSERAVEWPSASMNETINGSLGGVTKKYQTLVGMLDKTSKVNALKQCELVPDDLCVDAHDVGQLKDQCIAAVATEYEDLALCQTITRTKASCSDKRLTHARANCFTNNIHLAGATQAMCNEITHSQIRATCLERLETFDASE